MVAWAYLLTRMALLHSEEKLSYWKILRIAIKTSTGTTRANIWVFPLACRKAGLTFTHLRNGGKRKSCLKDWAENSGPLPLLRQFQSVLLHAFEGWGSEVLFFQILVGSYYLAVPFLYHFLLTLKIKYSNKIIILKGWRILYMLGVADTRSFRGINPGAL